MLLAKSHQLADLAIARARQIFRQEAHGLALLRPLRYRFERVRLAVVEPIQMNLKFG